LMALAIIVLLILTVVGGVLPFLQGWIFFVIALYLLASEFETGRDWVIRARRKWPALSRWIAGARNHRWAPRIADGLEIGNGNGTRTVAQTRWQGNRSMTALCLAGGRLITAGWPSATVPM